MMLRLFIPVLALLAPLAGCASGEPVGPGGGLLGMAPVSSASSGAASVFGNLMGLQPAKDLDDEDRAISADAITAALQSGEAGKATDWRNPATGHSGSITPGAVYTVNDYACRDYVHHVVIGSREDSVRATACRQPDGTWRALI